MEITIEEWPSELLKSCGENLMNPEALHNPFGPPINGINYFDKHIQKGFLKSLEELSTKISPTFLEPKVVLSTDTPVYTFMNNEYRSMHFINGYKCHLDLPDPHVDTFTHRRLFINEIKNQLHPIMDVPLFGLIVNRSYWNETGGIGE